MVSFLKYITEENKLPDLVGTDKQVKWAVDIRDRYLNMDKHPMMGGYKLKQQQVEQFKEWISTIDSASFFIDHRDDLQLYFMSKLMIEYMETHIDKMDEDKIYKSLWELRKMLNPRLLPKKDDLKIRYEKLKGDRDIIAYFRNK